MYHLIRNAIPLICMAAVPAHAVVLTPSDCNGLRPSTTLCNFDPQTGLHWLDWTNTTGRSFNDVSGKLGAGQEFDGFRYATESDVESLLSFYTTLSTINPIDVDNGIDPAAAMLRADLGITGIFTDFFITSGFIAEQQSASVQWMATLRECRTLILGACRTVGDEQALRETTDKTATLTFVGHALVAQGAVPVPEPAGVTLLALGLGCLLWRRRDRRRCTNDG